MDSQGVTKLVFELVTHALSVQESDPSGAEQWAYTWTRIREDKLTAADAAGVMAVLTVLAAGVIETWAESEGEDPFEILQGLAKRVYSIE